MEHGSGVPSDPFLPHRRSRPLGSHHRSRSLLLFLHELRLPASSIHEVLFIIVEILLHLSPSMAALFLLLQRLKRLQLSPLLHSALIPNQSITSRNNPVLSSTVSHFSKISIPPSPFRNSLPFRRFPTAEARIKYKIEKGKAVYKSQKLWTIPPVMI